MRLLRNLTLLYTGILVAALAASLTAIWVALTSVSRVLGEVKHGLLVVRDETEPLAGPLQLVRDSLPAVGENLEHVRDGLSHVDRALG